MIFDRVDLVQVNRELKQLQGYYVSDERLCVVCLQPRDEGAPDYQVSHDHLAQCVLHLKVALLAVLKGDGPVEKHAPDCSVQTYHEGEPGMSHCACGLYQRQYAAMKEKAGD